MALIDKKILNPIRYHQDNANTVIGQASTMKALFDQGAEDLRVKLNGVIDELLATTGAQQIGIDPARGLGNTLADALTNIKNYMNLGASGISATTIGTGSGNTVQSQLEWLLLQIQNVLLNQIPDGTITMQKLATALANTINKNTSNIGDLTALTTTEKTNLVGAVNELVSKSAQLTNPNLLINGDFKIWQRGTSFTANTQSQYTADRWMMLGSGDTLNKVDKVSNGLKITTASSYILYFRQTLEFPNMLGKTVTISCSVDGVIYKLTATINATNSNSNLTTPWGVFYAEYSTTTNLLSCSFAVNPSKTITINWVKLELGSIATPFHPKNYAEELASCQRYYLNKASGRAGQVETNSLRFVVPAPATMRNLPTISSFVINNISGMPQTGFTVTAFGIEGSTLSIVGNKTAHGLTDANIVINGLDAEIY